MRPQEVIINPELLSPIVMQKLQCTHSAVSCDIVNLFLICCASCAIKSDSETNGYFQYLWDCKEDIILQQINFHNHVYFLNDDMYTADRSCWLENTFMGHIGQEGAPSETKKTEGGVDGF